MRVAAANRNVRRSVTVVARALAAVRVQVLRLRVRAAQVRAGMRNIAVAKVVPVVAQAAVLQVRVVGSVVPALNVQARR